MPGVVFKSMEEFQQMAKAVNAVNRGGLEHPFYRSKNPAVTSAYLALMQYTDTDEFLGPMDITGVKITGTGNVIGTPGAGVTPETGRDLDATYLASVIPPDGFFWGVDTGETCYAVCGGLIFLQGLVTADGANTADIGVTGGGTIEVEFAPLCSDNLFEGQTVGLIFAGASFIQIAACCPPDP